jgi:hypothetical protein
MNRSSDVFQKFERLLPLRLALGHAPHKDVLDATPSPERIELLRAALYN